MKFIETEEMLREHVMKVHGGEFSFSGEPIGQNARPKGIERELEIGVVGGNVNGRSTEHANIGMTCLPE